MSAKRFNPYNVSGPRADGHVVRLNPGQNLHIMLDAPSVYGRPSDSTWEIVVKSDYLKLIDCEQLGDRKLYRFQQTKELKRWSEIATTFLGNILIYAKDSKMMMESHASLCVFLSSQNPDKTKHVVVVNPAEEHCVKLESHQILEVVFPDSKDSSIEWRHHQWPVITSESSDHLKLELIRSEVLLKDQPNNRRDISETFYAEHRDTPPAHHQRHYWFCFDELAKNIATTSDITENRPATRLFFIGKDPTGRLACEYSLQVNLVIKNTEVKPVSAPEIHLPTPDEHYVNAESRILSNPLPTENLSFDSPNADWVVELENPCPSDPMSGWEPSINEVALPHCQMKLRRLEVKRLLVTSVSGRQFQRFVIRPINTSPEVEDKTFLGVVSFKCNGNNLLPADRSIFCFFRSQPTCAEHVVSKGLTPPYASKKSSSSIVHKKEVLKYSPLAQSKFHKSSIYTSDYSGKKTVGYTVPCYSDVEIVDFQIGDSIVLGEKTIDFGTNSFTLKKNGIHDHKPTSTQPVALLPRPTGHVGENASAKENTVIKSSSTKVIFDPANLSQVPIIRTEPRTIRLPIVDMCIWSACLGSKSNLIVKNDNEVYMTAGKQYQSFTISPREGVTFKEGKEADVLMLTAKRGSTVTDKRSIILTVINSPLDDEEDRLPLGYVARKKETTPPIQAASEHIADVTNYRAEKSHGLPTIVDESSLMENRITLLDPLGPDPKQVELGSGDELEIVLHEPYKTHPHKGFRAETMMYSGSVDVPDNSVWSLWTNQKVQRMLFKFSSPDKVCGRVFIMSGSTRVGQVEIKPKTTGSCPIHRHDLGMIQWGGVANDGGYRCALFRWEDGQVLRLRSTSHMNISLERPSELLVPGFDKGAWHIEINQNALIPEVAQLVPTIDRYSPWSIDDGFLNSGEQPWESSLYTMRPLYDQQAAFEPLLQAFQQVYGNVESFPVGEITFKYVVPKKFTIQKRLNLELHNPAYYNSLFQEEVFLGDLTVTKKFFTVGNHNVTGLLNPENDSSVMLDQPGDCLIVKMRTHNTIEDGVQLLHYWNLHELPAWLTFAGEEEDSDHQIFFFHFDHVAKKRIASGRLGFLLGNGIMMKRIWIRGSF